MLTLLHAPTTPLLFTSRTIPQLMSYPEYVDGKPPVITLKEYDNAPWAGTTCVDRRGGEFVVVIMEKPETVVARVDPKDNETLDTIFKSAHQDFSTQLESKDVKRK